FHESRTVYDDVGLDTLDDVADILTIRNIEGEIAMDSRLLFDIGKERFILTRSNYHLARGLAQKKSHDMLAEKSVTSGDEYEVALFAFEQSKCCVLRQKYEMCGAEP